MTKLYSRPAIVVLAASLFFGANSASAQENYRFQQNLEQLQQQEQIDQLRREQQQNQLQQRLDEIQRRPEGQMQWQ